MGALDWMADVLRAAGLTVVEHPDWRDRRAPGAFRPRAVMWHHDASPAGPSPGVAAIIAEHGNGITPPPLAQIWVDTPGRWTLIASGRCNHAGRGAGWGLVRADRGNEDAIGIETDHTVGEPWPDEQLASLRRGTRALLAHLGASPHDALCGHREYAPGRKVDPDGVDMAWERANLASRNEPVSREDDVMRFVQGDGPRPWSGYVFKVTWPDRAGPTAVRTHVPNPRDPGYRVALATGAGMDPSTGEPWRVRQAELDAIPFATDVDEARFTAHTADDPDPGGGV